MQNKKSLLKPLPEDYRKQVLTLLDNKDSKLLSKFRKRNKLTLSTFIKNVCRPVKFSRITLLEDSTCIAPKHRAIVSVSTNKIISIVGNKYQLLPHKYIIDTLLDFFQSNNIKYLLGKQSYTMTDQMLAHFVFPEYLLFSGKKVLSFSMMIYNSYNAEDSFRIFFCLTNHKGNVTYLFPSTYYFMLTHHNRKIQSLFIPYVDRRFAEWKSTSYKLEGIVKSLHEENITKPQLEKFQYMIGGGLLTYVLKSLHIVPSSTIVANMRDLVRQLPEYLNISKMGVLEACNFYLCNVVMYRYRLIFLYRVSKIFNL